MRRHLGAPREGGEMILVPRFETEEVLKLIAKRRPTLFPGAPTMYTAIVNHPRVGRYNLRSVRACISGSSPSALRRSQKEAVRRSCQTMALPTGAPLCRSQTTVVSR